jgi:uncharacterized protein
MQIYKMTFHIYKDRKKEFRWRLVASNGKTVADSGEGYKRRTMCKKSVMRFALAIVGAEVVEKI